MASSVRTRYAPSPTGPQHIGGIRTALYAYLFAKSQGGSLILRIEDTDQKRYVEGAEGFIIESLQWCGIDYDEGVGKGGEYGPYRQSERNDLYKPYVDQLLESGNAYIAFDTPEELDAEREKAKQQGLPGWQYSSVTRSYMKNSISLSEDEVKERMDAGEPYVIRIKVPRNEEIKFEDAIRGWVSFQSSQLDDKVIWKADGSPTYHMANVVDDHLMKITHVIRGEEWLPSTPIHVLLYKGLGWEDEMPVFAHLPLILKPDGHGKLSKRDGDRLGFPVYCLEYKDESGEVYSGFRESGFFPDAFINIVAFLGWNPGTTQEIFSMDELIKTFTLDRVGKSGAKFDFEKAKWFNQQYLKAKPDEELADVIAPLFSEMGIEKDKVFLTKYCSLMKERAVFIQDLVDNGAYLYGDIPSYDEKNIRKRWKEGSREIMEDMIETIKGIDSFEAITLEQGVKDRMEEKELGFGQVFPLFRLALAGTMQGPAVFDIMELLGREMVLIRLKDAISKFDEIATKTA